MRTRITLPFLLLLLWSPNALAQAPSESSTPPNQCPNGMVRIYTRWQSQTPIQSGCVVTSVAVPLSAGSCPAGHGHTRLADPPHSDVCVSVLATILDRSPLETPTRESLPTQPNVEPSTPLENQKKPWPKICLTSGCDWQMAALAASSVGGGVYMAKNGQANMIESAQSQRQLDAAIEAPFVSRADANGYVPYSAIPRAVAIRDNRTGQQLTLDMDRVTNADRSIPVSLADVDFVARIISRIRVGKYRITPFRWTLVPTRVVNSSAFPDPPFVFVYTSILDITKRDPNQLAFVIGHEIGHTIDAQSCSGSGSAFNASFGIPLIQNQFQKFCENHADNVGLQLAAGAGFDPAGAIKLFQELQRYQERSGMDNASAFLSNHPLNGSRIENVAKLAPIIESKIEPTGQ